MLTDLEFLELFDAIVRKTKVVLDDYVAPTDIHDELAGLGLDSLDYVMVFMEFGEIYGIPEEVADHPPKLTTVQDIQDFISETKTADVDSVEEAMGVIS